MSRCRHKLTYKHHQHHASAPPPLILIMVCMLMLVFGADGLRRTWRGQRVLKVPSASTARLRQQRLDNQLHQPQDVAKQEQEISEQERNAKPVMEAEHDDQTAKQQQRSDKPAEAESMQRAPPDATANANYLNSMSEDMAKDSKQQERPLHIPAADRVNQQPKILEDTIPSQLIANKSQSQQDALVKTRLENESKKQSEHSRLVSPNPEIKQSVPRQALEESKYKQTKDLEREYHSTEKETKIVQDEENLETVADKYEKRAKSEQEDVRNVDDEHEYLSHNTNDEHGYDPAVSVSHNRAPANPDSHNRASADHNPQNRAPAIRESHIRAPDDPDFHKRALANPESHNRAPAVPESHNRAPVDSDPYNRAPVDPDPQSRAPVDPEIHNRAPVDQYPQNRTPADPYPQNRAPADHDPHKRAPVDPEVHSLIKNSPTIYSGNVNLEESLNALEPNDFDRHAVNNNVVSSKQTDQLDIDFRFKTDNRRMQRIPKNVPVVDRPTDKRGENKEVVPGAQNSRENLPDLNRVVQKQSRHKENFDASIFNPQRLSNAEPSSLAGAKPSRQQKGVSSSAPKDGTSKKLPKNDPTFDPTVIEPQLLPFAAPERVHVQDDMQGSQHAAAKSKQDMDSRLHDRTATSPKEHDTNRDNTANQRPDSARPSPGSSHPGNVRPSAQPSSSRHPAPHTPPPPRTTVPPVTKPVPNQGDAAWLAYKSYYAIEGEPPKKFAMRQSVGQPWPMPTYFLQDAQLNVLDLSNLTFNVPDYSRDVLDFGIRRFKINMFADSLAIPGSAAVNATDPCFVPVNTTSHSTVMSCRHITAVNIYINNNASDKYPSLQTNESYNMIISRGTITISAEEVWGAVYALETLSQITVHHKRSTFLVNNTIIRDGPRFPHRGVMIDTARHYITKDNIILNLEAMAQNKMNVLHWHLTDDQSFSYQSRTYPNLSNQGSFDPMTHIYTHDDIREVIEEARLRGIRVIPEFDTPGHVLSWGQGHPELLTPCGPTNRNAYGPINPARNSTYELLEGLLAEVLQVFSDQYIHMGGDEVPLNCWNQNAEVMKFMREYGLRTTQGVLNYYFTRLLRILSSIAKKWSRSTSAMVWQEVLDDKVKLSSDTIIHMWKGSPSISSVTAQGYRVVYSTCWYLDQIKPIQNWKDFYNCDNHMSLKDELLIGGEACMWGEYVDNPNWMSRIWPRTSAVAERLWWGGPDTRRSLVGQRIEEQRCRMLARGLSVGVASGPGFCRIPNFTNPIYYRTVSLDQLFVPKDAASLVLQGDSAISGTFSPVVLVISMDPGLLAALVVVLLFVAAVLYSSVRYYCSMQPHAAGHRNSSTCTRLLPTSASRLASSSSTSPLALVHVLGKKRPATVMFVGLCVWMIWYVNFILQPVIAK